MRIEQLQYLVEVAETGSMSIAAENNYISQQSLSEAIKKLEQEFEVDLVERSYKGVHLTETGRKFVEKAKLLLNNIEDFKKEFKPDKTIVVSRLKGNLKIIISPLININIMRNTLASFNEKHPRVSIVIEEKDLPTLISSVADNKADIGIFVIRDSFLLEDRLNPAFFDKEVHFKKLHSDKLVMCVGKISPLANRKSISIKEALKHPMIVYQPEEASNNQSWYISDLASHGEAKSLIVTSNIDVYRETIVKGIAIGYSSSSYVDGNPIFKNEITTLSVSDFSKLSCGLVWPKNRDLFEAAEEFLSLWHRYDH